jgi:uncharacterized membrane protein YeaQ/YmgE (transglycosylase-associated protein family)
MPDILVDFSPVKAHRFCNSTLELKHPNFAQTYLIHTEGGPNMRAPDPVITFIVVLVIGLAAGFLFDRLAGPSWLARQFSGSTRGIITSALVGIAGALIGYHIAVLLALGGGIVTSVIAAALGSAVVLFAWRMAK